MMGHTHALSGCAAWLAVSPFLDDFGIDATPAQVAAGTVVCAGAALLPDMDHHDGTIANTYGPVTRVLCRGVGAVSGGHRHMTHSFAFAVLAALGTGWIAAHADQEWIEKVWWVILFLLVGLGLRGIGIRVREREHFSALLNAALAGGLTYLIAGLHTDGGGIDLGLWGYELGWVGLAVGVGCVAHVVGDCLTPEGCPLLWPVQWRIAVPIVPRTDGPVEKWVVTPVLTLGIIILAVRSAAGSFATHWLTREH